ncbi:MAG TPA: rhodanese-like domain-containing protein [Bdellovibrionales bacterium]|nr:rhodanese-like domain-containing protein [Bdellovibrionales bacterium]
MPETTHLDQGRITIGRGGQTIEGQNDDVETISKEELYDLLRRHEPVQLINVLDPKLYGLGSIKGSLRIPANELADRLMEIDKSKEIVTYCANYDCQLSKEAARLLGRHGFAVRAYEGGIEEWKQAGLAVDLH